MIITSNLRVSAWCIPILGTTSFPTTTDVMNSREANIASSLNNWQLGQIWNIGNWNIHEISTPSEQIKICHIRSNFGKWKKSIYTSRDLLVASMSNRWRRGIAAWNYLNITTVWNQTLLKSCMNIIIVILITDHWSLTSSSPEYDRQDSSSSPSKAVTNTHQRKLVGALVKTCQDHQYHRKTGQDNHHSLWNH